MQFMRKSMQAIRLLRHPQHRVTARNFLFSYRRPFETFRRYLSKSGKYPWVIGLKTPNGNVEATLYNSHDLDTANQIFCRNDYPAHSHDSVFVDFGANIGLASLYFLNHGQNALVYAFEPSPENYPKLQENTACGGERIQLSRSAVSDFEGQATFALESSGRYGTLNGDDDMQSVTVDVVPAESVIDEVLAKHGHIDVLKVDVEGTEETILRNLRADQLRKIDRIYAEYQGDFVPEGFRAERYGFVTHFLSSDSSRGRK